MPGVIMMAAMFALFTIEMWMNAKMGGHSHGGPMGLDTGLNAGHGHAHGAGAGGRGQGQVMMAPPQRPQRTDRRSFEVAEDDIAFEKKMAQKMYEERMRQEQFGQQQQNPFMDQSELAPSEMPPWFIVFYEQYVRQRLEMMNMIKAQDPRNFIDTSSNYTAADEKRQTMVAAEGAFMDEEGQMVDPLVFKKMSMNITLLEGGILFHSVFVGMTISITIEGFIILLVAMLFHQMFEGLGLGSRIAAVPYPKGSLRPWVLVVAFGCTCPIGQAIGLAVRDQYDPNSAFGLIIVGVFNAM